MSSATRPKASEIGCPVCGRVLNVGVTNSRKGKVALVLVCPEDGRHFRAFINDPTYVRKVLDMLAVQEGAKP